MATISRIGFGQVEPNHLSAQRNGQVYGQLPAAAGITVLENGQFVKYDYKEGVCNTSGAGEWMLVYNEVKLYDNLRESTKDFALTGTGMVPRVMKTNIGDIFTTNCLEKAGAKGATTAGTEDLVPGSELGINTAGFLSTKVTTGTPIFQVVKVYTLPDGQAAVKVMRVK